MIVNFYIVGDDSDGVFNGCDDRVLLFKAENC